MKVFKLNVMPLLLLVLSTILIASNRLAAGQGNLANQGSPCINGASFHYNGTQNVTRSNRACVRWNPSNRTTFIPLDGGNHNYCRNPTNDPNGIWCYTSLVNITREYCFLPKCTTDARVIWTAYNVVNRTAHLFALHADPELIRQRLTPQRTVAVEHYFNASGGQSEFWTVTSDYDSRRVFFVDYRAEYIGVHSFNTSTTEVYHDGMGHGIENMAYDPISQNLYWTDSELRWVMATDSTFRYYSVVYNANPDPVYALAIHIPKRRLFFSTYGNQRSKILSTDMAGYNRTVILSYPAVDDVTGLAIDYDDDKLYWTDFVGSGSIVAKSNLDGTNRTTIHRSRSSIYWSIAIHLQYVYVTDVRTRFTTTGRRQYYIFMISKFRTDVGRRVLNYGLASKPRGITVFEENQKRSKPSVYPAGECSSSPRCDHICLPRLTGPRVCKCALGYIQNGETGCTVRPLSNASMILADAGQGKVFHISLSSSNTSQYNIIPLKINTTITTIAVNVPKRFLYWSDQSNSAIYRATFDGGNVTRLVTGRHAKRMAIDQQSGNVFFVDDDFQNIIVMNMNGLFLKTLYKPESRRADSTSIGAIALDIKNKFIYWTDTNRATNRGELRRMRFDGRQPTLVLVNLTRPSALAVDLEGEKLYLAEGTIPLIYSFPLASMSQTEQQTVNRNTTTTYDLRASFRGRRSTFLSEMQIQNGRLYFYDGGNRSMEMFDLERGTSSVRPFGPREFFRVRSMTIFDESNYQNFEAVQGNPCSNFPCNQLCLAITPFSRDCDCQDGWAENSRGICLNQDRAPVDHPPIVSACEADRNIVIRPCQNRTRVTWATPVWTDDNTATADLQIQVFHNITSPAILSLGQYRFRYSATDSAGNIGFCSFSITISSINCGTTPFVRSIISQTQPLCQNNAFGFAGNLALAYFLSCSSREMLTFGSYTNTTLVNDCMSSGRWRYSNFYGIRCGAAPVIPTRLPPPVTTAGQTEFPFRTTTSTRSPTTIQATTSSRGTTTRSQPTTTPQTPTTITTTTTTSRTTSKSRANSPTGPPKTTTTIANKAVKLSLEPTVRRTNKGLSNGAIAGIVVLAIALFAIIGSVVFVKYKKSGTAAFTFWKKPEDGARLRENVFDDINHYTVL